LETVKIEKIVNRGYGLGRLKDGKVVFVEGAYPGEEVIVRLTLQKSDHAFAEVVSVVNGSEDRVKPRCKYFRNCGGCHWMDLKYEKQLEYKREVLKDLFTREKINVEIPPVEGSDLAFHYRTKMEFHFEGEKLGLRKRNSNVVVDVRRCEISPEPFNEALEVVRDAVKVLKIPIYDWEERTGVLKHLVLRYAFSTDQLMVIFVTKTENFPWGKELKRALLKKIPGIHSIVHVMNSKDSVVLRGPYRTIHGEGVITEEFDWEKFQIPPTAFFQSNYSITAKLMRHVFEELQLKGNEFVLDLYAGVGTFSIRISYQCQRVIAVESSKVAVKAAKANANINGRRNVEAVEGDVLAFLKSYDGRADKVVLDPPRGGAGKEVMRELLRLSPERIVYVSCDPPTLIRDLKVLLEGGYSLVSLKAFDMFPHTYHIETVATLAREVS